MTRTSESPPSNLRCNKHNESHSAPHTHTHRVTDCARRATTAFLAAINMVIEPRHHAGADTSAGRRHRMAIVASYMCETVTGATSSGRRTPQEAGKTGREGARTAHTRATHCPATTTARRGSGRAQGQMTPHDA